VFDRCPNPVKTLVRGAAVENSSNFPITGELCAPMAMFSLRGQSFVQAPPVKNCRVFAGSLQSLGSDRCRLLSGDRHQRSDDARHPAMGDQRLQWWGALSRCVGVATLSRSHRRLNMQRLEGDVRSDARGLRRILGRRCYRTASVVCTSTPKLSEFRLNGCWCLRSAAYWSMFHCTSLRRNLLRTLWQRPIRLSSFPCRWCRLAGRLCRLAPMMPRPTRSSFRGPRRLFQVAFSCCAPLSV
jgi:hypothetical protein